MPSNHVEDNICAQDTKYTKRVSDHLSVSICYVPLTHANAFDVVVEFHNTLDAIMHVNPSQPVDGEGELSWLKSVFKLGSTHDDSKIASNSKSTGPITVFLGYLQLVGYVVLNYRLGPALGLSAGDASGYGSGWWENSEYWKQYGDANDNPEIDTEDSLERVPFIRNGHMSPLVVGGKLGGFADLPAEILQHKNPQVIDEYTKYFLHDIPYSFNTAKYPKKSAQAGHNSLLQDLSRSIVPFYCTPQTLMFTELLLDPQSTKTLRFSLPTPPESLPPSYNVNLTGLSCDQGWASIKYSLIVGLSYMDNSSDLPNQMPLRAIYMPYNVCAKRSGTDHRWIQPNYFVDSFAFVDQTWGQIRVSPDTASGAVAKSSRINFLKSLHRLKDADLHNLPKLNDEDAISVADQSDEPLRHSVSDTQVIQLSHHLKTQFQIRANSLQICMLSISKPYYHVGDCISFAVNLRPTGKAIEVGLPVIYGFTVHLEAHELFYPTTGDPIKNIYRVSASQKFNTVASTMISVDPESEEASMGNIVSGKLSIQNHLSAQFESSRFMGLKYYLVFRFIVGKFLGYSRAIMPVAKSSSLPRTEIPSNEISYETFRELHEDLTGSNTVFRLPLPVL